MWQDTISTLSADEPVGLLSDLNFFYTREVITAVFSKNMEALVPGNVIWKTYSKLQAVKHVKWLKTVHHLIDFSL